MANLATGLAAALVLLMGCASTPGILAGLPAASDAPYELADDEDLDAERDRFDALADGAVRDRLRERLAAEYAERIDGAMDNDKRDDAYAAFQKLCGLWSASELREGARARAGLKPYLGQVRRIREVFARSGGDHETAAALLVMAFVNPQARAPKDEELDEIFEFGDDLSIAEFGPGAARARPIEIIEGIVDFFPEPTVVDRLLVLYRERQKSIDEIIRRQGADLNLIRAHGSGVLRTSWHIVRVLARAGRLSEAPEHLKATTGIGDDPDIARKVSAALKATSPDAWVKLSAVFRVDDEDKSDIEAELSVLEAAIARFPKAKQLYLAAGNSAFDLNRIPQSIGYFEKGIKLGGKNRQSSERLAALYEAQVVTLALGSRVKAATENLAKFEAFHDTTARQFDRPIKPDLADAYAAMGQGLVGVGDLNRAQRYLTRSIGERPTMAALEYLGTVELKRDRYAAALRYFERALSLPVEFDRQKFRRNKLLRLAGEASLGAGDHDKAGKLMRQAMERWEKLVRNYELNQDLLADLLVETGKIQWRARHRDSALAAFEAAIDSAPNNEQVYAEVVSFLLNHDEYSAGLDAYHRALGSPSIGSSIKVYMTLWVVAEAKRQGIPIDPFARDYVAERDGRLWQDDLCRFADGRINLAQLEARARTRRQRTETWFYAAVVHEATTVPEQASDHLMQVLGGNMVLDFEYEMAKHWLVRKLPQRAATSSAAGK